MSSPTLNPESPWLTYSEVKRKIESCFGPRKGKYTMRLWTQGDEPLLPKRYIPGTTRAVYSRERAELLLKPKAAPANFSRP